MGLESATLIRDLNVANPAPGDNKAEGDDHIRLTKRVLKTQFPNLEAPITKTAAQLNATNRVAGSTFERLEGNAPMLEYHRPGHVAFATLIGSDNRWYLHTTNGGAVLDRPVFSMGAAGDGYFNNSITVQNSITCAYGVIRAAGAVSLTMAINGLPDRNVHRNGDAMGFLGVDGAWNVYSHNNGDLWARGNISAFSDERVKKDWRVVTDDALRAFANMTLVGTYENIKTGIRMAGVSAQQLREVLPEAVTGDEDTLLGVAYGNAALTLLHKLTQKVFALEEELRILRGAK